MDGQSDSKKRKRSGRSAAAVDKPAPLVAAVAAGGGKGLRHFSLKVCEKVEAKRVTTYNEVADELVAEFCTVDQSAGVDQKNIRRRVYDALNVLMAMDIITKDKKAISWRGLPGSSAPSSGVPSAAAFAADVDGLLADKAALTERLLRKRADLTELMQQQLAYRALRERNVSRASQPHAANARLLGTPPPPPPPPPPAHSSAEGGCIMMMVPFIIVNTRHTTVIECEVADDRTAYFFNMSEPFEIHDDTEVLARMNMRQPSGAVEQAIQQLLRTADGE
eukprot:TRINITY_DN1333_c0_g1_i1.p1 TRINITY_DN1333_c0_g1~~TRINITY_DN1333_c0_g1_i1.p1  ORF type:complete len:278 (-),score=127.74 TRINITY_DN1333_c0_g1_i1:718-1551(-)